jgi:hypothetical protein
MLCDNKCGFGTSIRLFFRERGLTRLEYYELFLELMMVNVTKSNKVILIIIMLQLFNVNRAGCILFLSTGRLWCIDQKKQITCTGLMFCLLCIIVHQYSKTNLMHFLFNSLRIGGLYMFRTLIAHPQEALHKPHLVYCLRVQPTDITRTQYTKCCL